MTVWEDIQTSLNDFWNWLTGVGGGLTDSLGELGSWLYGGIKWLADQFYNAWTYFSNWLYSGLQYLSDRFKEGYEAIAQWISGGLQWIGSGLSWIGQQLYSFGQWVWNGIVNTAITVANTIEGFINWIWESIVNIYNDIVNYLASWVQGINDFLNDWIKSLRNKFKDLVLVNTTLPAIFKSFDMLTEGKLKEGILGMLISPFAGAIAGELVDVIVPRPSSERVMFFPEFLFPTLNYTPITIEKPTTPTTPIPTEIPSTPMYPPSIGYRPTVEKSNIAYTLYDIIIQGIRAKESVNKAVTEYELLSSEFYITAKENLAVTEYEKETVTPIIVTKTNDTTSEPEIETVIPIITPKTNKTITEYTVRTLMPTEIELTSKAITDFVIVSMLGTFVSKTNYAKAIYSAYLSSVETLQKENHVGTSYVTSIISPTWRLATNRVGVTYDAITLTFKGMHYYNYARTLYDAYVSPVTKLSGLSKAKTEVTLLPSIGVAIVTTPSTRVMVETYMPYELPQYQEGTGTSYEIEVIPPASSQVSTNKVGTSYEIGGTVTVALVEAIIYLDTTEYAKIETTNPFSEDFVTQGIEVSKSEPENAMFEDWYISAG